MGKNGCWELVSSPLQLSKDGATVCFTSAVIAPLFPLVVFACCALLEIFKPTSGITAGLQAPMRDSFFHPSSCFLRFSGWIHFFQSGRFTRGIWLFCKGFWITAIFFVTWRSRSVLRSCEAKMLTVFGVGERAFFWAVTPLEPNETIQTELNTSTQRDWCLKWSHVTGMEHATGHHLVVHWWSL